MISTMYEGENVRNKIRRTLLTVKKKWGGSCCGVLCWKKYWFTSGRRNIEVLMEFILKQNS